MYTASQTHFNLTFRISGCPPKKIGLGCGLKKATFEIGTLDF